MAWVLITGGAKRLGAELCYGLAEKGYSIAVHYNTSQLEALAVAEKCRLLGVQAGTIQGDFSTVESTIEFAERYVRLYPHTQALVNNVGNYLIKSALETEAEEWTGLFQSNLHAPFILSKALAPSLVRHCGQIINIGMSGIDKQGAHVYSAAYMITKGALLMLTRSLALELAPHGVRVNMVSPGYLDIAVDLPEDCSKLPMRRAGQCREISRVVSFLLDPASQYITGQNIEVAGGVGLS
ncbi:SDR family oxidoreductase [Candidatus Protochlamydia phocaeensis]|uniref:SDR family oxidoreductase n=1 Tax=Candidatus Protochlamydia phocaeensis TaxID=1414722 RepID=UPI0008391EF9|nr:SDR family oxidoreductase [Candidatus Protochlamydia phocaeensis]